MQRLHVIELKNVQRLHIIQKTCYFEDTCLIDKDIRFLSKSIPITLTFTISPKDSFSEGCLIKEEEISDICTNPS